MYSRQALSTQFNEKESDKMSYPSASKSKNGHGDNANYAYKLPNLTEVSTEKTEVPTEKAEVEIGN